MSVSKLKPLHVTQPSVKRPNRYKSTSLIFQNFARDQFTLQTWLALGAAVQMALFTLPIQPYYAASPVVFYLAWEIVGTLLIMLGVRADPMRAKAIPTKYTTAIPDEEGNHRLGSQGDKVTVFFLGFRNHHHLGMLAPGYIEFLNRGRKMFEELEARADELGLLSLNHYTNSSATNKNPERMYIMYFKSNADVVNYANGPLHRDAWNWFSKVTKKYPHLGIMHELYEVPAGLYEGLYVNIEPTLLATASHKVVDHEGEEKWISSLVDASKGRGATHLGRIA